MKQLCHECGRREANTLPAVRHVDGREDRTCRRCWCAAPYAYFVTDDQAGLPAWLLRWEAPPVSPAVGS